MRVFDRDLIRGGHYGQRSCEPHLKAEHMAAPTNAAMPRAKAASCPHLADANIRVLNEESGFDPKQRLTQLIFEHPLELRI
jgi:hypothetical protein